MKTIKQSSVGGGGGETEFEQAFSSLAYAYLRDKAPRLLDHMIGFQLVDRNDDNTKAMGVFGFQIGSQWLYAPVFFLNGDLKGHELLYLKNNDSFVPMKESWINYIMSRKPHILGESSAGKLRDLGGVYPDIRTLSIPPSIGGGKRASDNFSFRRLPAEMFQAVKPMLAAFKVKAANSFYRISEKSAGISQRKLNQKAIVEAPFTAALAKVAAQLDLNQVIPTNFALLTMAHGLSEKYPTIKKAFDSFYGKDCFYRWGTQLKAQVKQAGDSILSVPTKRANLPGMRLIPAAEPINHVKSGALRLYTAETVTQDRMPELTDAERERLLNDTMLIVDHRRGIQVSRVYNTQIEAKMTNPSETALYRVLEKPGEFTKMLVTTHGSSNRGREPIVTVVRLGDDNSGRKWVNTYATNVFCDQINEKSEWNEWFESLSSSESLSEGSNYIALDATGSATVPFKVTSNLGDGNYRVNFDPHVHFNENRTSTTPRLAKLTDPYSTEDYHQPSCYDALLCVDKEGKRGTKLRAISGELRVPGNFKFLKLQNNDSNSSPNDDSNSSPIQLGRIEDVQLLMHEKTARLKLFNNGTDVFINSVLGTKNLSKRAALWELVSVHGLDEPQAREILKQAEAKKQATYRVHYAPGYGTHKNAFPNYSVLAGGPDAPVYDDLADERSTEQYGPRTSANTQYAGNAVYRLNHLSADQTDPGVWNPWQNYEAADFGTSMQVAQQAGASGQKEVFDTTMLAGMLKSVRQDSLVERHLSSLVESLDSLGRLLMNFYWHGEEFEDRYGKSDMPELEDSLRNAFESIGDVTLFLKEKSVESPFDQGDIDLSEVGRN
jgi:hypothetical protein